MTRMTKDEVVQEISEALAHLPYEQRKAAERMYWNYVGENAAKDAVELDKDRNALISNRANAAYANAFKQRNG